MLAGVSPLAVAVRERRSVLDEVIRLMRGLPGGLWLPGLSLMWQDSTMTTPVTGHGDPVGAIADISGNGLHAIQATSGNRPLYQTDGALHWLLCDGSNDGLYTASLDLTAHTKLTLAAAARKLSDAAAATLLGHGRAGTDSRAAELVFPRTNTITGAALTFRDGTNTPEKRAANAAAPVTQVLTALADYGGGSVATQARIRTNGVEGTTTNGAVASGNFGNYTVRLGGRDGANSPFNGRFYGGALSPQVSTDLTAVVEALMANRSGVAL